MRIKVIFILVWISHITFSHTSDLTSFRSDSVDIYNAAEVVDVPLFKTKEGPFFTKSVQSPSETLNLQVMVSSNSITYEINKENKTVIAPSLLDLTLGSGNLCTGLTIEKNQTENIHENLVLPYGEQKTVLNNYKEFVLTLKNKYSLRFELIFRVYDEGVGFRYRFPEDNTVTTIRITKENTQFHLNQPYTAWKETYNERGYTPSSTDGLRSLIPLTLTSDQFALVINEAGNDNYARITLTGNGQIIQTHLAGTTQTHQLPFQTPWRYIQIAEDTQKLVRDKYLLYGLNNTPYNSQEWEWVKPGTVFRCVTLTTEGALEAIDFCSALNIDYMMFDAGWYGLGYGKNNEDNPASNPMKVIDDIDMPTVVNYAKEKNIGIILYINKVAWYNYDNRAMFDLYESWGIKGLKLGFMDGYSSYGIKKIYDIVKEAGKRRMIVNVHDNFRPTGLVRKYPNLMTAEGVRGNEYTSTHSGNHTTLIPYTRMLTGATDYTICFKESEENYPSKLKTSKGHQLALSVINYSPLQHIMWYGRPSNYKVPLETELFSFLPTVWEQSVLAKGEMGNFVSYARKKDDQWFLATINNETSRVVRIPLSFLEQNSDYEVTFYRDKDSATIEKTVTTLENLKNDGTITPEGLQVALAPNSGEVAIFRELEGTTGIEEDTKTPKTLLFPNPANNYITLQATHLSGQNVLVRIFSCKGQALISKHLNWRKGKTTLNVSSLPEGCYLLSIESKNSKETHWLYISH
ncbi:glycoside hydrolase family 97 catalytic domain-containing protein [Thermophagus xiamenensis]|uniref:Alpha-glucosidase n=1 Tax=Thermophagus xiamenensis TaxID=385682 RepID=A0A1I1X2F6_9BACT|nr:glycoside hydrolase family 97 catalytic domain-containing protein [Thermophagus xiamenensis]SFE01411.1 alpha-glucosidase [Thermophagus xiamenensis]